MAASRPTERPQPHRRWLRAILRSTASLGILVLVAWEIGPDEIVSALADHDPRLLLAIFLVMLLDVAVRSSNWRRLLRPIGVEVGLRPIGYAYLTGGFWGVVLPSSFGMDAARAKIAARLVPMPFSKALASMISLNALGLLTGTVLGSVGALWLYLSGTQVGVALLGGAAAASMLGGIFVGHWLFNYARDWVAGLQWRKGFVWQRLQRLILGLGTAFRPLGNSREQRMELLAVAAVSQVLRPVILWLACRSVGVTVPWAALILWIPLGNLVNFLPISVAGFGGLQAAHVYYLAQFDVSANAAFAASMIAQVMQSMVTLLGGLVFAVAGDWHSSRPDDLGSSDPGS